MFGGAEEFGVRRGGADFRLLPGVWGGVEETGWERGVSLRRGPVPHSHGTPQGEALDERLGRARRVLEELEAPERPL